MSDPSGAGGDPNGGNPPTPTPGTPPAPPQPPPPAPKLELTQEDLDRTIGARVAETKRQATRQVVSDLGFTKIEDLQALVTAAREAETAKMTETDRLKAEAATAKAQAEAERGALASERHAFNVERALTRAKVQGDPAMLAPLVRTDVGADQAAIDAAVEQLKVALPALFGVSTLPSNEPSGGGYPSRPNPSQDPLAAGAERAKRYMDGYRTGI